MNKTNLGNVTVYIWDYRGVKEAMGHASMSLSDGTHISWWPIVKNPDRSAKYLWTAIKSVNPNGTQNLEDDIKGEEKNPDLIVKFPPGKELVDEDKIRRWWNTVKDTEKYHLRNNNCSTMIYRAFQEGGVTGTGFDKTFDVWTPGCIRQFVSAIYEAKTKKVIVKPEQYFEDEDDIRAKLSETHIQIQQH